MTCSASPARIDIRPLPPRERHPLIFSTFNELVGGQTMELINDHDPQPLHDHFQAELPGRFGWEYLERGPDTWRVTITRLASAHGAGQCCGSCGGA